MGSGTDENGRGLAVDLVETVAALRGIPDVRDAIVTERTGADGVTITIGYVTGPEPALGTDRIRQQMLSQLPRDMVPQHFVVLEEFTLTPEGEYDLAALPEPDTEAAPDRGFVAPSSPMEQQLTRAFREILGIDEVGIYDSFFALGGSSLQATYLTSRIFHQFRIKLSLPDMFTHATVAELSTILTQKLSERANRRYSLKRIGLAVRSGLVPRRRKAPVPDLRGEDPPEPGHSSDMSTAWD
jgi:acyl carrier protein